LGLSQQELFGKTDFDLFPARLAEHFRRDDRDIFESRKPKLNILELVFNSQGLPDWYLTNKYPIFNDRADVIGLMGTVRPYGDGENKELKWERDDEIGRAVNHIRNNFRGEISISDLVEVSGIPHRKLHRGFVELFGTAPMQFITRTRIEAACDDLLSSSKKLSIIAGENGFYDQSSFTQLFRRQMKITPLKYRKQRGFI
jgi:AraC-like DNA-binding protein